MPAGYVKLATGEVFTGEIVGQEQPVAGEVVFNTSMTGYQEIMTDPSYAGQIVTFCYPLIGNYGIQLHDNESRKPKVAGIIVRELCNAPSHYGAVQSMAQWLQEQGLTALVGVDTRALVKTIRQYGTVQGIIACGSPEEGMKPNVELPPPFTSSYWVDAVSTKEMITYPNSGPHIVLVDLGMKKSILDCLLAAQCQVTVVPYSTTYEQIKALQPDGVVYSNGPGDPVALTPWLEEVRRVTQAYPTLGICLGHQVIALAYGAKTKKMKFGHRGGNHPVKDLSTGKVLITPQNHSYVVEEESVDLEQFMVAYQHVNDGTVEGLTHKHLPIYTVQFHPEAHPGPSDTAYIFHTFLQHTQKGGRSAYALA
ncbi:carbamoyl-phosphate synthase arginine-specific small chain [Caldalkalibacillus thermarum]|uniref:carbamoyl phosphate synthase small subunit n=1 Tax=Caldalkalibacillus thermarum TaxID=296745 RepID=UPI001665A38B|nr:carbamoyl phosphate synthase small subunit [Caldalkalibacillus thermarum]GGK31827.1 carbamoyl-phosphate synthase arginine-specific small chain [Caldalkalibacillus thermarum]